MVTNSNSTSLIVDQIYKSNNTIADDPLYKLLGVANMGGFRIRRKNLRGVASPAFIVLYTSKTETEWPDLLDETTGIFRYYGHNREPGPLERPKGNQYLSQIFADAQQGLKSIPPFLIFEKYGTTGRSVRFKGLAVPGRQNSTLSQDLVALWRSKNAQRFQNYEAYFSVLDINEIPIDWLLSLVHVSDQYGINPPKEWKTYLDKGLKHVKVLHADKIDIPTKESQLPATKSDWDILNAVFNKYRENPTTFENCAIKITELLDSNFIRFIHTRPTKDGGRDGLGEYKVGNTVSNPLKLPCILEAKCYNPLQNSVGVHETSRLISRIRAHSFGVFVTTSYIAAQAYSELIEDNHPILIITGKDIVNILKRSGFDHTNINEFFSSVPED